MNRPPARGKLEPAQAADTAIVAAQLGRSPRAMRAVAHRCHCGLPDVVQTSPRLTDATPFPTLYYLTCPRAAAAVSRLEATGVMREMTARLATDPELRVAYQGAHVAYLRERDALGRLAGHVSAGGMPDRVKCLHAVVAHSLAVGPGVNPFGDEALEAIPPWWEGGPCVAPPSGQAEAGTPLSRGEQGIGQVAALVHGLAEAATATEANAGCQPGWGEQGSGRAEAGAPPGWESGPK